MEKTNFFRNFFTAISIFLLLHVHRISAGYSRTGCDVSSPTQPQSCYGRGSSDCSDAAGNILNGNETYTFLQIASANYITFVCECKYEWQAGVFANLYILGAVGIVIQLTINIFFVNLLGCPSVMPISNSANSQVDGLSNLSGADIVTALNLGQMPYTLTCNVYPVTRILDLPYQNTPLAVFLRIDFSGIRSFVASQNGNPYLKSMAQMNVVKANVTVTQTASNQINVQQPGGTLSTGCLVDSAGGTGGRALAVALGNVFRMTNMLLSQPTACSVAIAIAQFLSSRNGLLLDNLRLITMTKTKAFIFSMGYTAPFLVDDLVNGILSLCERSTSG